MEDDMSETRITNNGTDVIYTMAPYIAEALGEVLRREGHEKGDQGWGQDGEALIEAATGDMETTE
jgi:predicted secreted protein